MVNAAANQFQNPQTNAPVQVIDPTTGQTVLPANAAVNQLTGQVVNAQTGQPLAVVNPTTGQLTPAIAALAANNAALGPALNAPAGQGNNPANPQPVPAPVPAPNSGTASVTGRDAINLIFLSQLVPSSLPPPIVGNDGRATVIQGSLRDILGPDLSGVLTSTSLVPGQALPTPVARQSRACNVVRSGETVPFRVNPRGGTRLTSSECDAIGQLLDKFVPTFLQNFVPSDIVRNDLGNNNNNNNNPNNNNNFLPNDFILNNNNNNNNNFLPNDFNLNNNNNNNNNNNLFPSSFINNNNLNNNDPGNSFVFGGPTTATGATNINDFINVRNDGDSCTIAVPNIVPQC
ncbi:probable serine/threonine-protein kinase DDB_G0267686 [Aplysia californica]|uniref:Probable serine/threonine-protein kinase DDB_G0267686 n=1 Tax=Aplysia californica TaxID=6500 RepID=A0ABM1A8L1_APLCA|nr:probable serine/threonine-protein kinase DDB_G0267686 [Aplysia californica]